jgi:hypothetical protein
MDSPSFAALSTEFPQSLHRWCTVPTSCPHDVEALSAGAPLQCGAVSQTPTYDQLRGERINADVRASEADPHPLEHPGRHRLRDDTPTAATVCGPFGPRDDFTEAWSWFGTGESGRAEPANATRPAHSLSGTHRREDTTVVHQQPGSDQWRVSEQAPRALLPPPAHARDRRQHGGVGAS